MCGELDRGKARQCARAIALLSFTLALGGCGGGIELKNSPLDLFKSSPKATAESADPNAGDAAIIAGDIDCPDVTVRSGAATLIIGGKPGEAEPSSLDVRYQG